MVLSGRLSATMTAFYGLNNNANDSVGGYNGTAYGAYSFVTRTSVPIEGTHCLRNSSTSYIGIPAAALNDLGSTGTIKVSFMWGDTDGYSNTVLFSWTGSHGSGFLQIAGTRALRLQYTTSGSTVQKDSVLGLRPGRWYQASIQYTATDIKVDMYDYAQDTTVTWISDTGTNPVFTGTTSAMIGNWVGGGTLGTNLAVDAVSLHTGNDNGLDFTPNPYHVMTTIGDSIMVGTVMDSGTCGTLTGTRLGMYNRWNDLAFGAYPFGMSVNSGYVFTNGTNAFGGYRLYDASTAINTIITNDYSAGPFGANPRMGILVGLGSIDAKDGFSQAQVRGYVHTIADAVHTWGAGIKVFFCTAVARVDKDVSAVNAGIAEGVIDGGANTHLIDVYNGVGGITYCSDNIHLTAAASDLVGAYAAQGVYDAYNTPTPTPTPTLTPTMTPVPATAGAMGRKFIGKRIQ